jgi:hypothetical protein
MGSQVAIAPPELPCSLIYGRVNQKLHQIQPIDLKMN